MNKLNTKKQSPTKVTPNKKVPSTSKTPSPSDKSKPSSSVKPKPLDTLRRQEAKRSIPTPTVFNVRSETVNFGKDYEVEIAALLGLRCSGKNTQDMWLGMNLKEGKDFDDVVLYRQTQDDKKRIYLIQLKFQNKSDNINLAEFKKEKGDFSLKKYLKSISSVERNIESQDENDDSSEVMEYLRSIREDVIYFIYTNRKLLDQSLCKSIKTIDWQHKVILTGGKIFQFDHKKCSFASELEKYSKKLYLLTEQIHINKLETSIVEEIARLMQPLKLPTNQLRDIGKHLVSFITSWSKGLMGGYYLLTKDHIWKVLLERALTPYMVKFGEAFDEGASDNEVWSKIIEDKEVTIICNEDITSEFVNNHVQADAQKYYEEYKALRADKTEEVVKQTLQTLSSSSKIKIVEVYEFMWKSRRIPLLLKVSNTEDLQIVLKLVEKGKGIFHVIVLVQNVTDISLDSGNGSFMTLKDLNEEHRKEILRQNVQLQGRTLIKLEDVVTNIEDAYGLTAKDIIHILSGSFNIGTKPPTLPETFIDRSFERVWLQNTAVMENAANAFIIKCNPPNNFQSFIQEHKLEISESQICQWSDSEDDCFMDCDIMIVEDLDLEKIKKLSALQSRNVHYLVVHSNLKLEWVRSFGSTRSLNRFVEQSRYDNFDCQNVVELMHITDQNVPFPKLIVGCSGMGKSCLMDYVTVRTSVDVWILKINLPEHSDYFKNGSFQNSSSAALSHLAYFADRCSFQQNKEISKRAFKRYLDLRKIFIIFDAFDEVPLRYQSTAKKLIKSVNDCGFPMCVTTRPVLKIELEELLDTFAVNLKPFSPWDQQNYLLKYFSKIGKTDENNSLLKEFVEDLIDAAKQNINDHDLQFTGVPLLSKLLAEVFAKDYLEFRSSKRFHNRNFDLMYLYKHFIDEKTRIACEKLGQITVDLIDLYRIHKHFCALQTLFSEEELEPLSIKEFFEHEVKFRPETLQMLQKDGIVVPEGSNVRFLHRSFAEFLVAEWLSENVNTEHRKAVQDLVKKVLKNNLMFVRNMFDRMLAAECPLHLAIINSNPEKAKEIIEKNPEALYVNDDAGRSVLHVIASWGVYHLTSKEYIESDVAMQALARWIREDKALDLLKLIPRAAITSSKDDLLEFTPLDYAIIRSCYHVANAFCERKEYLCQDISIPDIDYDVIFFYMYKFHYDSLKSVVIRHVSIGDLKAFIESLKSERGENDNLHDAIKEGNITKATALISTGYDVNETDERGCTPVHIAVMLKQIKLLHLLLEGGSMPNLDVKDKNGRTPLHWAAIVQHKKSIQLLLSHSADVNVIDELSRSALHYLIITAIGNKQNDVLRCFIELTYVDSNMMIQDKFEKTPLHYALHCNQVENLELILNYGISVHANDDNVPSSNSSFVSEILSYLDCDGAAVLHWAASRGMKDAVKLLVDYGALPGQKDKYGRSALLCAIEKCHAEVTELLIDGETALEIKNDLKQTVLIVASKTGQECVVRLLLDKQIHIDDQDSYGMTALHWAAYNGHVNVVSLLLSESQNYEIIDKKNNTALIYASKNGHEDVVKLLLDTKAEIDGQDDLGKTSLYWATVGGHQEVVRMLLEAGANSNIKDKEGRTALMVAMEKRHRIIINLLLDNLKDFEVADDTGSTVVLWAATYGRTYMILELIKRGADCRARNFNGETALMQAAKNNRVDTVRLLLENGADIDAQDKNNFTSFDWAINKKSIQTAQFLLDKGANISIKTVTGETSLMLAAEKGLTAMVNQLLVREADIEGKNNQNMTPLHFAAKCGGTDVVHLLVSKGANLEVKTGAGKTPLMLASENGHLQIAELLIEKGTEIDAKDSYCYTALHWAVCFRQVDVVRLLLNNGANYKLKNKHQKTPLMIALQDKHADMAELLLNVDVEVDVNEVDDENRSFLYWAALGGQENLIKLLLDRGANPSVKTNSGVSILMAASSKGHTAVVEFLLNNQMDTEEKDTEGMTALHYGAKNQHVDSVNLLLNKGADCNAETKSGSTALIQASIAGDAVMVELLLSKEIDIEAGTKSGMSSLHHAAFMGHTNIANLLLNSGANLEAKTDSQQTPIMLASKMGRVDTVELFLERHANMEAKDDEGRTALFCAASSFSFDVVELLIDRGANMENKNNIGRTVINTMSLIGSLEAVNLLLDKGANSEAEDIASNTAWHYAAFRGHVDIIQSLLEKRANFEGRNAKGRTPLLVGCLGGSVIAVETILDAGASAEVKDNNGDTCLHLAALEGHIDVVKLLISRRLNCESKNIVGKTALMCASQKGHTPVAKTLLEQQINIDMQDNHGMTCMHWAAMEGHANIVELLVKKGANLEICNNNGQTALIIASEKQYDDVVRFLSDCQNAIEAKTT